MDVKESIRKSFRSQSEKDAQNLEFIQKTLDSQQKTLRDWQKARLALVEDVLSQFNRWLKALTRLRAPIKKQQQFYQESRSYKRSGKIPIMNKRIIYVRLKMTGMRFLLIIRFPFILFIRFLISFFYRLPVKGFRYLKDRASFFYYVLLMILFSGFVYFSYKLIVDWIL